MCYQLFNWIFSQSDNIFKMMSFTSVFTESQIDQLEELDYKQTMSFAKTFIATVQRSFVGLFTNYFLLACSVKITVLR